MSTQVLFSQHAQILAQVQVLDQAIAAGAAQAPVIAGQLRELARLLSFHLTCEDVLLYPNLFNAADPQVAALARQMISELGGLAQRFHALLERWSGAGVIAESFAGFVADFQALAELLTRRIAYENDELYPRVECVRN